MTQPSNSSRELSSASLSQPVSSHGALKISSHGALTVTSRGALTISSVVVTVSSHGACRESPKLPPLGSKPCVKED